MKVSMDHPDFPKGHVFDLGGVSVENGGSVELSKEDVAAIEARHGQPIKEALGNSKFVKLSNTTAKSEGGE